MIQLYVLDISNLKDPAEDPALLHALSSQRRKKTMGYRQPDDRKRSLGAGILLAEVLPLYGDTAEDIVTGPRGKPEGKRIHFNLSHSGALVICAVGERAVGCDIEQVRTETEGMAERLFHPGEVEYLRKCDPGERERDEMFFRLWTLKESYVKMTGDGMYLPLSDFEIVLDRDVAQVRRDGRLLPCHMKEYQIPGYKVSVCAEEERFSETVSWARPEMNLQK